MDSAVVPKSKSIALGQQLAVFWHDRIETESEEMGRRGLSSPLTFTSEKSLESYGTIMLFCVFS